MVVHDKDFKEFSERYLKMSDKELFELRKKHIGCLFAGQTGSQDYEERKAIIELIDKELERRYKRQTIKISVIALVVSIISLLISLFLKIK